MKRKWDILIALIGGVLALIFFGGLAVTMKTMSVEEFSPVYQQLFADSGQSLNATFNTLQEVTAFFGLALFGTLILLALAVVIAWRGKYSLLPAVFYGLAGLILLFGTQFIGYPLAFCFFVACGLYLFRLKNLPKKLMFSDGGLAK